MKVINNQFPSIEQVTGKYLQGSSNAVNIKPAETQSFSEIYAGLQSKSANDTVKFSKHAAGRLNDRNIELTNNQLDRLNDGMKRAGEKGINESLVLVDELAFIVNIKNATVITAMDKQNSDENVFTNIDGAVIA